MGFWGSIGNRVRGALRWDKEKVVLNLAKGGTSSSYPSTGFDLLQAYGYDVLSDYLKLEHDLMSRYVDYEEMDDYPELACLAGDSLIFTMEDGWIEIQKLAERGGEFHVLSYDRKLRSLVPALATGAILSGEEGHGKPMVKVTFDNGSTLRVTTDHPFLTKDEQWVFAGDLHPGDRLMPGMTRLRQLNGTKSQDYWQVHQPQSDSQVRSSDGKRWVWMHRLVGEHLLDAQLGEIVHHRNHDPLDNRPSNLEVVDCSGHAYEHIAKLDNSKYFPAWTEQRRLSASKRMRGNTHRRGKKASEAEKAARSRAMSGRVLSEEHKRKIGDAHRIIIERKRLESAWMEGGTVAEAARILGVSWSKAKRELVRQDMIADGGNHRVVRVDPIPSEAIYDLEVPGFENFVCNGVVVHNTAIDIYADDATQVDSLQNRTIWVDAPDKTIKAILTDLYEKRLRMDEEAWSICRTLVKYGNDYEELLVAQNGVVGVNFLPPPTMRRIEGRRGELFGFVQDFKGRFGYSPDEFKQLLTQRMGSQSNRAFDKYAALEDWEVVHMRLRSKHRRAIYGFSTLEPARWIWKRLMLLEDAAMIYRLQRAPERYAFYVDVGDMPPKEAMAHLHKVRQQYRKTKFYNPQTGKLDLKFNPLSQDEDFFLPIRKGVQGSKIEVLSGPNWQHMDDINYFRLKLFASIKVPKAYLGYEEARGKATGANDDVRFARTVLRTQRELRNGLSKIGRVHLAALGINPAAVEYQVYMTVPSSIFELAQLEVRNAKADFAGRMSQFVSLHWILQKIFGLSEEDINFVLKERHKEALQDAEVQAKAMGMQLDVQNSSQAQMMQTQQQMQQGQAAIANAVKAPPGTKKAEDAHARLRDFTSSSRLWSQIRQGRSFNPITEQELFTGNREHERKMEDKLNWMQEHGVQQNKNMKELGGLLRELAHTRSRPSNS